MVQSVKDYVTIYAYVLFLCLLLYVSKTVK